MRGDGGFDPIREGEKASLIVCRLISGAESGPRQKKPLDIFPGRDVVRPKY
jgi:hypothetical protein